MSRKFWEITGKPPPRRWIHTPACRAFNQIMRTNNQEAKWLKQTWISSTSLSSKQCYHVCDHDDDYIHDDNDDNDDPDHDDGGDDDANRRQICGKARLVHCRRLGLHQLSIFCQTHASSSSSSWFWWWQCFWLICDLWKAISPSDAGDLCLFENFGNSLDAYNTQHTKRHSLLWENRKQTEVGVKWSKIISRSSILHWVRAIGWTQKECRMPRYLKSLGLGQAAGFYHIPIRSVGQHGSRHFQHINRLSTQPDPSLSLCLGGYVTIYVLL